MTKEELREKFEKETSSTSWINSDIYPCGRIYTKSYTEWLEAEIEKRDAEYRRRIVALLDKSIERNEKIKEIEAKVKYLGGR